MSRVTVRAGQDLEPGMPARSVHAGPVALPTIEARVFALVADLLGIDVDQLSREVSVVEDLAADSLDLAEIAVAIESALDVTLPQRFLDRVRTCGELIDGAVALARTGREPNAKGVEDEVPVRARVTPAGCRRGRARSCRNRWRWRAMRSRGWTRSCSSFSGRSGRRIWKRSWRM